MKYTCAHCGQTHDALPDLAFDGPVYADQIPADERDLRVKRNADLCVIDGTVYFIRGLIEIPVHGQDETFGIGAWVSQKPEHFWTYQEQPASAEIGPFFGWLSNEIRGAGASTLGLKSMVHFRGGTLRPRIVLEPTDHPLAVAQRAGLSLEQAWAFLHACLDPSAS